jgi:signal transduction histidine kinase
MVRIDVVEDHAADIMTITVADDGSGMDAETAQRIRDPFVTSRTTREVGLGIPLFAAAAERCGGRLEIISAPGVGTTVRAIFGLSHIDRAPLGDMAGTLMALSCIIVFREMNPSTSIRGMSGQS